MPDAQNTRDIENIYRSEFSLYFDAELQPKKIFDRHKFSMFRVFFEHQKSLIDILKNTCFIYNQSMNVELAAKLSTFYRLFQHFIIDFFTPLQWELYRQCTRRSFDNYEFL